MSSPVTYPWHPSDLPEPAYEDNELVDTEMDTYDYSEFA